jgi:transposase
LRGPPEFNKMYSKVGRPSIPPEQLLRALLLQLLYSVRSERLLIEELDYNILFCWFVGLNLDDAVWDSTVFTKNRDRLLEAEVAKDFLAQVVEQARGQGWGHGRALHGGRKFAGSVGQREEVSAQEPEGCSAG